ncbi:hypothetical protein LEP1GSC103_0735 [Leptospira borgpetersenii serovar Javanica str. UI 09931]|uniref:Uncharacterized protein n=5 Tax=Leptospira borgpetersenii TaxID=174 RepID=M3HIU9_LEPBO|nr:hypothetical protein LBBP_04398 [Leptospira borgpetersenii serovar Ballum]EKP11817.1 hypothetical protein LEP1GSC128_1071 [Leptospira borgpetersenii str. 200801926]EKQ91436.1 hypothetical protein LEP1GSC101_1100 [Leptospira borgpetersenii str. UI 09149]EKR01054.1 hypothetical protein LEP1GSC121_1649 [Leptospira borgpetersenii serovar Castellonis str. 200801910]EMF97604.1 hypothetical protein LEP1GSC123_1253 [Leptospira borgpetersenii str. 200701203]EMK13589.1 hypothetical protein LEP1GSC066
MEFSTILLDKMKIFKAKEISKLLTGSKNSSSANRSETL